MSVNKAGFMAAVAVDDSVTITGRDGLTWTAIVLGVSPNPGEDLMVQEPGVSMVTYYTISETELNLHIEGKGDF